MKNLCRVVWAAALFAGCGAGNGKTDGPARDLVVNPNDLTMVPGSDLSGAGGDLSALPDMSKPTPDMFMFCNLHGKVQTVNAFGDYKVQVVTAFPDVNVQMVNAFPDNPGQWEMVDAFPDFTVEIVDAFPDFTIQYVDAFPGCP